jgi:ABC-2 type transport system permease protein
MISRKARVIFFKELFAYPTASFIWVLADAQTALILPAVWLAASPNGVAGMDRGQLVSYYLVSMVVSQFVTCHLMWDIAWDIREGVFSSQIMRPIGFFWMNVPRNFCWRVAKLILFIPLGLFGFAVYAWHGVTAPVYFSWEALLAVFLGQTLSFVAAYCVALVALWTTEFFSILRVYYFPEMFLSGRIVPLATMPLWVQHISKWTHFRLTNAFPVQIILRQLPATEIRQGLVLQILWIGFFLALGAVLFRRGTRQYTGVGM